MLALIAAIGAGYLQFGLIWSADGIMPKLDKISPLAGLKRMFSMRSLAEFVRGLLKLAVVGVGRDVPDPAGGRRTSTS